MFSQSITYKKPSNPCVRCGTERIVSKQWKEKQKTLAGTTEIVFFQTICPNPACQALVDKALREEAPKARKPLTFAPKEMQAPVTKIVVKKQGKNKKVAQKTKKSIKKTVKKIVKKAVKKPAKLKKITKKSKKR